MTRILGLLSVLLFVGNVRAAEADPELTTVLDSLDWYLDNHRVFFDRATAHVDSLKAGLRHTQPDSVFAAYRRVADAYKTLNMDSAAAYYEEGRIFAADHRIPNGELDMRLRRDGILPVTGGVIEANRDFNAIPLDSVPAEKRLLYYQIGSQISLYIYSFQHLEYLKERYRNLAMRYNNLLLPMFPEGSMAHTFILAQNHLLTGESAQALGELREVVPMLENDPFLSAKALSMIADYYAGRPGKEDIYLYYLAKSAIVDLSNGCAENNSLERLGRELYKAGDVERAYKCLNVTLKGYLDSGARINTLNAVDVLPEVYDAVIDRSNRTKRTLYWCIAALAVLLLVAVGGIFMQFHNSRKLTRLQLQLRRANETKKVYIKQLLKMCNQYGEAIEDYNRYVGRKIKAGQSKDLLEQIENGKMLREASDRFYESFDESFQSTCPDFVVKVNSLLSEDKQFALPADNRLTQELRMLALIKLGIIDSEKLSKFLGLSLNTIYTYRNRLKTRALNREKIEEQIENLDEVEL